jgi:hypothetical protein
MSVLNRHKYRRLVPTCWKRMQAAGLGTNTRALAEAGLALINSGNKRTAHRLLNDWHPPRRADVDDHKLSHFAIAPPPAATRGDYCHLS